MIFWQFIPKNKTENWSLTRRINKDHEDPIFYVNTDESDNDVDSKDKSFDHCIKLNKLHAQEEKNISASNENKIDDTVKKKSWK